jgi:hypothetical protein
VCLCVPRKGQVMVWCGFKRRAAANGARCLVFLAFVWLEGPIFVCCCWQIGGFDVEEVLIWLGKRLWDV